jgi:predicted transposase YbfD/YdcC
MLCGYKSYSAMAEWGRNYGQDFAKALGFTHRKTPCAATLHYIFRSLDTQLFESRLGNWAEAMMTDSPGEPDQLEVIDFDGKTLRGTRKQGAPAAHLLSALGQRLELSVAQQSVDDKTNEITAMTEMLKGLLIENRVITMDALLTQRAIAEQIVNKGGDYLMVVKDNQAELLKWISALFDQTIWLREAVCSAETKDAAHGRIEMRKLSTSSALNDHDLWPGLEQVLKIERSVIEKKSGKQRHEVVYAVTSLKRERASAEQLLEIARQHWHIENRLHWVRDVTFDEDRSQVRCGSIPQIMAAFRNTAIGLMRRAGETNIAAACRRFAAQPWAALSLIGIKPKN